MLKEAAQTKDGYALNLASAKEGRTYFFATKTEQMRKDWIDALTAWVSLSTSFDEENNGGGGVDDEEPAEEPAEVAEEAAAEESAEELEEAQTLKGKAEALKETVKEKAEALKETVKEKAETLKEKPAEAAVDVDEDLE